jgi:hypothetical protein
MLIQFCSYVNPLFNISTKRQNKEAKWLMLTVRKKVFPYDARIIQYIKQNKSDMSETEWAAHVESVGG